MSGQTPFPDDFEYWDNLPAEELDRPEKWPSDEKVDSLAETARKKAAQTHDFRESLFKTVRRALVATLLSSVIIMGLYLASEWGSVSAAVMISFNAAVVVNTIGLAYIIANYLFPSGGAD